MVKLNEESAGANHIISIITFLITLQRTNGPSHFRAAGYQNGK